MGLVIRPFLDLRDRFRGLDPDTRKPIKMHTVWDSLKEAFGSSCELAGILTRKDVSTISSLKLLTSCSLLSFQSPGRRISRISTTDGLID